MYAQVALNAPLQKNILTYLCKDHQLKKGDLVEVPLGRRKEKGVVLSVDSSYQGQYQLKEIAQKIEEFQLSEKELELYQWAAQYYHYPLGKLVFDCLPKIYKKIKPARMIQGENKQFDLELNSELQNCVEQIIKKEGFEQWLIHGVTGSGKSLIFFHLMKEQIEKGNSALLLVPEINLTPQFINFYSRYLNCPIYPYHSQVQGSQKYNSWLEFSKLERPAVVIGARSSLFCPIKNLGMILIDEEHDHSYKQEDRCHFHARDLAIKKAQLLQIPIIMASATPSLESYQRFTQKLTHRYLPLRKRYSNSELPVVEMSEPAGSASAQAPFTSQDIEQCEKALTKGKVIIFINKLGFANFLSCQACNHRFECPNCSVSLTYFKKRNQLECHLCSYHLPKPSSCPNCGCLDLFPVGVGTERVYQIFEKRFPDKKIIRFDRDEVKNHQQLEDKLKEIYSGNFDILIGTQMLAKGHNFKNIELILVLGLDQMLSLPDFRAAERAYQLMTQVLGRAGRFGEKSRVRVLTQRDDEFLADLQNHEFEQFYQRELPWRESLGYPPYQRCVVLHFRGKKILQVKKTSELIRDRIQLSMSGDEILVKGPAPNLIHKHTNEYRYHLLLFSKDLGRLHQLCAQIASSTDLPSGIRMTMDVDPHSF